MNQSTCPSINQTYSPETPLGFPLQVVDVQQHFVKPQPNELAETVLTEDCKTETGLDEELVKQAPPLDHALEEVSLVSAKEGKRRRGRQ